MFKHIRSSHWYFRPPSAAIMPRPLEHARRAASADPDNAHYWGTAALLSERALGRRFDVEKILRPSTGLSRRGVVALGKSMEYYSRALDLNPNDDCFLHNIAWIHALMGRGELAYSYLERALAVYKTGEYQISAGLILERLGLEDRAFSAYVEALAVEPDIVDSRFSQDLEKRYPGKIHELVDSAIHATPARAEESDPMGEGLANSTYSAASWRTPAAIWKGPRWSCRTFRGPGSISPCWLRHLVRVENGSLTCSVLPSSVEETSRHGTIWLGFSTVERRSMRR